MLQKKLYCLVFPLIIGSAVFAQSQSDLKGPKAKNQKVWQDDNRSKVALSISARESLNGPEAKNQKVKNSFKIGKNKRIALVWDTKRRGLKGPAAKNYKPWK